MHQNFDTSPFIDKDKQKNRYQANAAVLRQHSPSVSRPFRYSYTENCAR